MLEERKKKYKERKITKRGGSQSTFDMLNISVVFYACCYRVVVDKYYVIDIFRTSSFLDYIIMINIDLNKYYNYKYVYIIDIS